MLAFFCRIKESIFALIQTDMSRELEIFSSDTTSQIELPLSGNSVAAGFPSPAEEYIEAKIDLNRELIRNPASTFFARVSGVSMVDDGIDDGDLLIIDKSIEPYQGALCVAALDGEFTLKRLRLEEDCAWLIPANEKYEPIKITADNEFIIWGVVRYVVKKM